MANWMKGAVKPSRRGVFKKKAKAAGMSTAAYARKEKHAGGKLGEEANLALTFARFRPKGKSRGGVHDRMARHAAAGAFGRKRKAA